MTELAKHVPDVTTFAANLVVFFVAIGAAVAGSMAMLKKIREGWEGAFPAKVSSSNAGNGDIVTQSRNMVGALLMETTTAAMLSDSQRSLCEQTEGNTDEMRELRFAVTRLTDAVTELRHEMQRRN